MTRVVRPAPLADLVPASRIAVGDIIALHGLAVTVTSAQPMGYRDGGGGYVEAGIGIGWRCGSMTGLTGRPRGEMMRRLSTPARRTGAAA